MESQMSQHQKQDDQRSNFRAEHTQYMYQQGILKIRAGIERPKSALPPVKTMELGSFRKRLFQIS